MERGDARAVSKKLLTSFEDLLGKIFPVKNIHVKIHYFLEGKNSFTISNANTFLFFENKLLVLVYFHFLKIFFSQKYPILW